MMMILEIESNQNCCSLKGTNKIGKIKITIRDDGKEQMAKERNIKTEGLLVSMILVLLMIRREKINKRKIVPKSFVIDVTNQDIFHLNVPNESKNYKRQISLITKIMMKKYFFMKLCS